MSYYTCCEDGMLSQVPPTDSSGKCPACRSASPAAAAPQPLNVQPWPPGSPMLQVAVAPHAAAGPYPTAMRPATAEEAAAVASRFSGAAAAADPRPVAQMVALDDGLDTVILDFLGPRPPAGTFLYAVAAAEVPTDLVLVPREAPLALLQQLTGYDSVGWMEREHDRNTILERLRTRWAAILDVVATSPRQVAQSSQARDASGSPARQGARPDGQDLNPVSVKDLSASASPATKEQQ